MNAVRQAIYARLHGDVTLAAMLHDTGAIYHRKAPQEAQPPFIIFQKSSGTPERTYGAAANRIDKDVWIVKAIVSGESATSAEDIAARVDVLLDRQALTVTGKNTLICERQSDIDYDEVQGAVIFNHVGALYRVWTQP